MCYHDLMDKLIITNEYSDRLKIEQVDDQICVTVTEHWFGDGEDKYDTTSARFALDDAKDLLAWLQDFVNINDHDWQK